MTSANCLKYYFADMFLTRLRQPVNSIKRNSEFIKQNKINFRARIVKRAFILDKWRREYIETIISDVLGEKTSNGSWCCAVWRP